ncbi:hypothetical protein [uncultured Winogradskyella sp.]|uniref:HYC_CC_PP family protein n=1 Tax=uncultured Winogradskyella sp. TaxID=395353 RepID=UPI002625B775|nr:hypothetical protein [uncultured Winogradskyella sp.]
MKSSVLHKILSIVLSLLVLVSTLSLTIEKHFCGDTLIDVAIFSESEKCGMQMSENKIKKELTSKSCCKDEVDVIKGLDKLTVKTFDDLEDLQKQVLFVFTQTYINLFESLPKAVIPNKDYSPPLLVKDIQVLDETYLI